MAYLRITSAAGGANRDAQDLHAFLVSCTDDIGAACGAVEAFLKEQPPEAALGFFRLCFPLLLQKVFGFHDSASASSLAWLVRATDEQSASALRSLLHPSGHLFVSLLALDREKAVQFVFPNERLPLRVRRVLLLDRGVTLLSQTSELFKNRMKVSNVGGLQLQLDLFEYYMFWFAYYAASSEDDGSFQSVSAMKHNRPSPSRSFSYWVSSLHPTSSHHSTKRTSSCYALYLQLLHLYLTQFVQLEHFTGVLHIPGTTCLSHGGFLLLTVLEFWLMKDDTWPLQASQLGAVNTGFTHSGVELDAVRLIVNHSNRLLKACLDLHYGAYEAGNLVAAAGVPGCHSILGSPSLFSPTRQLSPSSTDIPNVQLLQRPLYRFISRAFVYWPAGISVKQAWYLVELWVDYMQPWMVDANEKSGANVDDTLKYRGRGFSALWQGYVTRNYPFYTALVVHYLNFALKYVSSNLEPVLEMTTKVLGTLVSSKDLLELLRKLDLAISIVPGKMGIERVLSTDMDWEENAPSSNESKLTPAFSLPTAQEEMQKSHLFALGEGGAFHTFQMLISQCEAEILFVSPESQRALSKSLEYVKHAGLEIFNPYFLSSSMKMSIQPETHSTASLQDEVRVLGRHTCFDVKYRGDWMRRPIESTEVACLVRFLVKLSDIINKRLNLAGQDDSAEQSTLCPKLPNDTEGPPKLEELNLTELLRSSKDSVVTLSFSDLGKEMKVFLLSCWAALCAHFRRHGWRVNLRCLAQKPVVVLILVVCLLTLRKLLVFSRCICD